MPHGRVRPICAAALAFAALALSPGSAGAHPADCAGATALTSAPIAVSFADWTVDCSHATAERVVADSDVTTLAGTQNVAFATSASSARRSAPREREDGRLTQVGHEPLMNRGMNAAIAVHGNYAYIGSRTDGGHVGAAGRLDGGRHLESHPPRSCWAAARSMRSPVSRRASCACGGRRTC